jgi:ribose transport system substrate-binding protein
MTLICLFMIACGGNNGKNDENGNIKWNPTNSKEIAYVLPNVGPYYDQKWYGIKDELTKLGYTPIMYQAGGYKNTKRQIEIMDNLIQKKVAGIILHATSADSLIPSVENAIKNGIPVIAENVRLHTDKVVADVNLDIDRLGWEIAMFIVDQLNGEGNIIALIGPPGLEFSDMMWTAASKYFAQFPGIKVLKGEYLQAQAADALKITESLLTSYKNVDAIYCWYVQNAIGAAQAVKAAGIEPRKIVIAAKDINPEGEDLLKEGYITGLLVGTPIEMGRTSARTMVKILSGQKYEKETLLNNYLIRSSYVKKINREGFEIPGK